MLIRGVGSILCSFLLLHSTPASVFSSDPRLLRLVPPESQIVAGMLAPTVPGQMSSILLVTRNNEIDQKDFFALTGGDPTRSIHEVVFVATVGADKTPDKAPRAEHSLLVSGHFDRDAIFRLANHQSITRQNYRGVAVLVVQPLTREAESFKELRWFAIPDERIAVFGSVVSVQRELDRWIANSPIDAVLLERLRRLDQREDTWCLLPALKPGDRVASILGKLDARLGALADEGRSIQYGIHFGKKVEITASNSPEMQASWKTPRDPLGAQSIPLSYFLSGSSEAIVSGTVRVKIRRQTYEKWLVDFGGSPLIDRQPLR